MLAPNIIPLIPQYFKKRDQRLRTSRLRVCLRFMINCLFLTIGIHLNTEGPDRCSRR